MFLNVAAVKLTWELIRVSQLAIGPMKWTRIIKIKETEFEIIACAGIKDFISITIGYQLDVQQLRLCVRDINRAPSRITSTRWHATGALASLREFNVQYWVSTNEDTPVWVHVLFIRYSKYQNITFFSWNLFFYVSFYTCYLFRTKTIVNSLD